MSEKPINTQTLHHLSELRDQLALQSHLLRADLKERWNDLEAKWADLQEHVQRAGVAAKDSRHEVSAAAQSLADALKDGYAQIRSALKG